MSAGAGAARERSVASAPRPRAMAPSLSRLPLTALRAFVVAARHLSFARAAAELHVTPAAISQQIRQLEEQLGRLLFRREAKQLYLTDAGQACLPGLTEGFERLLEALTLLEEPGDRRVLTVSVAPSFAAKWLLPRIEAFGAAHPEIDLRRSAVMTLVRFTLLHDASADRDASCPDWAMWLKAAGVKGIDARRGPHFDQSSLVLEAAALGRGVALAKARLAEGDLRSGRLVRLFAVSRPIGFAYYFVCPPGRLEVPRVRAFHDWLVGEAAREDGVEQVSGV